MPEGAPPGLPSHRTSLLNKKKRIGQRFHLHVGDTFVFGPQSWSVVGSFEAPDSAYDSEIWADLTYLGSARKRDLFSSVFVKPVDRKAGEAIKATNTSWIASAPRDAGLPALRAGLRAAGLRAFWR